MRAEANIATISVPGDLDVLAAPALKRSLEGLIDGGCRRVVVNMANAGYVDSAGMGAIVVMPLRVGRVEGVEGQQRPEPLAAFAGDQGLTRDLAGYGQARAFDGVVGVERHETVHRVGDAGLDQGQIR